MLLKNIIKRWKADAVDADACIPNGFDRPIIGAIADSIINAMDEIKTMLHVFLI
ncbi:MAG: hypothetical protein IKK43_00515 [Clostridia bacterium]|nr:hypothetical protein [Clostridia bacterium]